MKNTCRLINQLTVERMKKRLSQAGEGQHHQGASNTKLKYLHKCYLTEINSKISLLYEIIQIYIFIQINQNSHENRILQDHI